MTIQGLKCEFNKEIIQKILKKIQAEMKSGNERFNSPVRAQWKTILAE